MTIHELIIKLEEIAGWNDNAQVKIVNMTSAGGFDFSYNIEIEEDRSNNEIVIVVK